MTNACPTRHTKLYQYRRLQDCEEQVERLQEIKKAYLKALKKQHTQAKKGTGKKRNWKALSRTSSKVDDIAPPPDDDADDEDDQEEEEEEESLSQVERVDSVQEVSISLCHQHLDIHIRSSSAYLYVPGLTLIYMHQLPPPSPLAPPNRRSSLGKVVRRLSIPGFRSKRKADTAGSSATQSETTTPATPSKPDFFS